jgi:hypothetical protein
VTPPSETPGFIPKLVGGRDFEPKEDPEVMVDRIARGVAGMLGVQSPAPDPNDKSVFPVQAPLLASSADLAKRRWIGGPEGFAPGTVSAISGPPKSFKSTLALGYAISLAAGIEWAGIVPERPYKVLYVGWEDCIDELRRRAHGFVDRHLHSWRDVICRNLAFLPMVEPLMTVPNFGGAPRPTEAWHKLERTVAGFEAQALMVDTLADLHDSDETNQAMRAIATPLREMAQTRDMVVACVAHDRKDTSGTSLERLRGGGAFGGVIRRHIPVRPLSKEQAEEMKVPEHLASKIIAVEPGSNQYGPPSPTRWFIATNHILDNGDPVAVLEQWDAPAAVSASSPDLRDRLLAAIALGYAGDPLSDHRNAGPRSFYGACEALGLADKKAQEAMLQALKRDHGVVVGKYAKPRKTAGGSPYGLRTADGKPDGVRWIIP